MIAKRPVERVGENIQTELWLVDCESVSGVLETEEFHTSRLCEEENVRAERIADARDRQIWRASHIALRVLIERWGGDGLRRAPFEYTHGGRPELPRPAPSFSLSHSGNLALIALTRRAPIGADLQEVAPRMVNGERRQRMEEYAVRIARGAPLPSGRDLRFVQAWTRIEALAKADGRGIGKTLTEAGLIGARAAGAHTSSFMVCDVPVGPGFAAAVATQERPLRARPVCDFSEWYAGAAFAGTP